MKTNYAIQTRAFPVLIKDLRTGAELTDMIVFEKQQLKSVEALGLTPDDLIYRHFNPLGFRVLDIGKAVKRTITMDLTELYKLHDKAVGV